MKKLLKIGGIVVAVLLIVIAAAFLLLKSYLTDEKLRALVSGSAEKSLNRKVVLGDVRLSLFKGIIVKDIEVKEKDSETAFVRTKECGLTFQLLPLCTKRSSLTNSA